jgi:hypothetical protein
LITTILLAVLVVVALIAVVALSIGAVVLIKTGVIAKYLFKEEPPDQGDYDIGQSHEVN